MIDGLARNWNHGISPTTSDSQWNKALGEPDPKDYHVIPQGTTMNLQNPVAFRMYDLSGMGPGKDATGDIVATITIPDNSDANAYILRYNNDVVDNNLKRLYTPRSIPTKVWKIPLVEFRKRLIIHFNIAYQRHKIMQMANN